MGRACGSRRGDHSRVPGGRGEWLGTCSSPYPAVTWGGCHPRLHRLCGLAMHHVQASTGAVCSLVKGCFLPLMKDRNSRMESTNLCVALRALVDLWIEKQRKVFGCASNTAWHGASRHPPVGAHSCTGHNTMPNITLSSVRTCSGTIPSHSLALAPAPSWQGSHPGFTRTPVSPPQPGQQPFSVPSPKHSLVPDQAGQHWGSGQVWTPQKLTLRCKGPLIHPVPSPPSQNVSVSCPHPPPAFCSLLAPLSAAFKARQPSHSPTQGCLGAR